MFNMNYRKKSVIKAQKRAKGAKEIFNVMKN